MVTWEGIYGNVRSILWLCGKQYIAE